MNGDISKIVVLYKASAVNRSLCPDILRFCGKHVEMLTWKYNGYYWDYNKVRDALLN